MTEKLFYKDPYLCEFTALITGKEQTRNGWKLKLDRTAFYPEGGGQPADRGTLNDIVVSDVQKEGDRVYHFVNRLPESDSVSGKIEWDHRFEYMQQHTGQHILSAVLKLIAGAATVAVHQAEDYTSIEIDHSNLSPGQIEKIEDAANALVCANQAVYSYLNGDIPISSFPIRRETQYRENVRLVQIGGASLEDCSGEDLLKARELLMGELNFTTEGIKDLAACGGIHTSGTGEVGLIKYKGQEKVRGRLRLFWLIGKRAYRDYRKKTLVTDTIGEALSVPLEGIGAEFERFKASLGDEKKRNSDLLKEMASLKAEQIRAENQTGISTFIMDDMDPAYFKQITIRLSNLEDLCLCIINAIGGTGQWAVICTGDNEFDFNSFRGDLLPLIEGKGGGKAPLWQGKLGSGCSLATFRERFSQLIS